MKTLTNLCFIFASISLCLSDVISVEANSLLQLKLDDNTTDRCMDLMNDFGLHSSKFGLCATLHARPIKVCQKCVYQYQNVTQIYKTILQSNNTKGQRCQEVLLNSDRLGVLHHVFFYAKDLWTRGNCESCYVVNKTTDDHQLSNYTEKFIGYHSIAMACIQNHTEHKDVWNDTTVCQDCEQDYCTLNTFYNTLKDVFNDAVCMDIVDSMNTTRIVWSDELKCIKRTEAVDVVLISTLISVSLLTLLFYVGAKVFTSQTRNQLQAQKRFAEHVTCEEENNQPSTSSE